MAFGLFALPLPGFPAPEEGKGLEKIPYGDFERWLTRIIKESALVGGEEKEVYAIADKGVVRGKIPYVNTTSPWASSNVYAEVWGVDKVNCNVRPGPHEGGSCAVLTTEMISFRAAGMIRMNVITAAAIYLGRTFEPIRDMNASYSCVDMGIPFTRHPRSLVLDYAARIGNTGTLVHASGRKKEEYPGKDRAVILIQLQKRWEEDGQVYAYRVATGELAIDQSVDWQEQARVPLVYGKPENPEDLTQFGRLHSQFHTRNSEGKNVPIQEVGWAEEGTQATHLILFICSGTQGAYRGELGNSLSVDNIALEY